MKPFRFLHAADLHVDSPFRGHFAMPGEMHELIRESTFRALDALVETAIAERTDFVLICGDVYDAQDRSLRAQFRFKRAMERLAEHGIAVYVVHGNHDPLSGYRAKLDWPELVHFFPSEEVRVQPAFRRDGEHVADIYGISYDRPAVAADLSAGFSALLEKRRGSEGSDRFNIAMLHTNVDGQPGHDNYAPSKLHRLVASGFDYWALGHIHKRAVLHERPWVVYPGNTQGRSIRETGAKGVYVVDVDAAGNARLTFRPVDDVRWERARFDYSGCESEQELISGLKRCLLRDEDQESLHRMVRIELCGSGPLAELLAKDEQVHALLAELREHQADEWQHAGAARFVWPETIRVQTLERADRDALRAEDSFYGDLLKLADRLAADQEAWDAFLSEALAPLASSPRLAKLLSEWDEAEQKEWLKAAEQMALSLLLEGGRKN